MRTYEIQLTEMLYICVTSASHEITNIPFVYARKFYMEIYTSPSIHVNIMCVYCVLFMDKNPCSSTCVCTHLEESSIIGFGGCECHLVNLKINRFY
jgi:hypothetical protein